MTLHPLNIAAFTGGQSVPSARFRVRQYIEPLKPLACRVDEFPSKAGQYPPEMQWKRPFWLAQNLIERLPSVLKSRRYDLILFQRELVSTLLTLEPYFAGPRILDVDDAIWLHKRGGFAAKLARRCEAVICGNSFLQNYFADLGCKTFLLPTAVDTKRFSPKSDEGTEALVIGWSGSSANLIQLERLEPALAMVLETYKTAKLRVICDRPPNFSNLSAEKVEFIRWSPDIEVAALQDLSVGLMPIEDTDWSRGKCSYKMLTYMACGLPVVVSPVGMNAEVLALGDIGFGARSHAEWTEGLDTLLADRTLRARMGKTGRKLAVQNFSLDHLSVRLADIFRSVSG
ncbi:glycosyl transferase [Iodidimonas gelatinilytica]|uniref:Glycosyl transferase n=1 Tax=Iodidimonas gelatinilytica TaxID=1236966 RepID=A0A5A7MT75_9PROT|nr:glycosyltransferase family 4 protein [Iodidimonas gelatinilytica]GEQ99006.1 glycosyl transferase [Iodidimonas gelatinilytica]